MSQLELERRRRAKAYETKVAEVWDTAFIKRVLPYLKITEENRTVLLADCRTAILAGTIAHNIEGIHRIMAVDPDREMLNIARRRKVREVSVFHSSQITQKLNFADDVFGMAICVWGGIDSKSFHKTLEELSRVVISGGIIAVAFAETDSLPMLSEMVREELWAQKDQKGFTAFEQHLQNTVQETDIKTACKKFDLKPLDSGKIHLPIKSANLSALMSVPIIAEVADPWFDQIKWSAQTRHRVMADLAVRINTYYDGYNITEHLSLGWVVAKVDAVQEQEDYTDQFTRTNQTLEEDEFDEDDEFDDDDIISIDDDDVIDEFEAEVSEADYTPEEKKTSVLNIRQERTTPVDLYTMLKSVRAERPTPVGSTIFDEFDEFDEFEKEEKEEEEEDEIFDDDIFAEKIVDPNEDSDF